VNTPAPSPSHPTGHTTPLNPTGPVGHSVERADGPLKLSGQAEFTGDIKLPGMLYAAVLHSPVAHARIRSVDTAAAERADGVVAVLTSDDLSDIDPFYGHALRDRPVVALGKVRFAGEPVAVVAAETQAAADAAIGLIDVNYEGLPVAASVDAALAPDAPLVHEKRARPGAAHGLGDLPDADGNICYSYAFQRGDTARAFAAAAVVVEGEYTFPAVYQYAMETHTTIAHWQGGELTLWSSCQHPFLVRQEIAVLFGLALDRVRIIVPFLGGGFGSKSYTKMEPLTAAIARKAGRPVRILNAVHESMITTRRHGMTARMRTAAAADGTLLGRECQAWLDTGAYADNGPRVTATAGDAAPGPYRWQALDVQAHCVYTNTSPSGSYRAFGATHLQWIAESQLDEVARRLDMDRLELRRQNLLRPGEEVRPGGKPLDADLIGDVEKAAAAIGWPAPANPTNPANPANPADPTDPISTIKHVTPTDPTKRRGRGVSVGLLAAGAHPVSMATVRMGPDGSVTVLGGTTEMGQGARTVMAQIAAGVLRAPVGQVVMRGTDTRYTPYDRSTGASRSTTVAGLAVQRAAQDVLDSLLETAAAKLEAPPQLLTPVEGGIADPDGRIMTHAELVRARFGFDGGELLGHGRVQPEGGSGSYAEGPVFWEVCVAGAEVEVDLDTGVVTVLRTSTVADVGKAINPQLVTRQDEGATVAGLGNALFEEMHFAPDGMLLNDTLLGYRIPAFRDTPATMTCSIVENGDGPGPFGAKGCGEGALAAVPAAIVNALADAGVPMNELPLTPERVWRRIRELKIG
jgi:CO/xanthine dehydrogenase Mo-binding subunit